VCSSDLNAGAVGWTDWNILLDERGGPNHVGNFCFAPVHADRATGALTFTPSFAYLGHFSKFIRPGAQRVSAAGRPLEAQEANRYGQSDRKHDALAPNVLHAFRVTACAPILARIFTKSEVFDPRAVIDAGGRKDGIARKL
jgi:hypothetical protein